MPANPVIKQVEASACQLLVRLLPSCFLSLVLLIAHDARAEKEIKTPQLPPPHTAYYHLYKGIVVLAKTRRTFEIADNKHYIFSSYTEPAGMGRVITGATIKEQSYWTFKNNHPTPLEYSYINSGGENERDVKLVFDWDQNKVTNFINGDPWTMDLVPMIQDKLLYQFSLMLQLQQGKKRFTFEVADGGKLKIYVGRVVGEGVVSTDIGKFNTVIVLREHDGKKTRFWCAKKMHFLPIQIEQTNKEGSSVTATLYDIKGLKIPMFDDPDW